MASSTLSLDPVFDEERRMAALQAHALLDSEPEREFDALVSLAADMLDCPLAALTLIDRDRLWVKAGIGDLPVEVPRSVAICNHTIRKPDQFIVDDLSKDADFAGNPLVVENGLRFYAGMPIHAPDRQGVAQPIGSLCVMDATPRSLNESGMRTLRHLTTLAEALIAARAIAQRATDIAELSERQASDLRAKDRTFQQAERISMIGSWRLSIPERIASWSDGVFRIHELPVGEEPDIDTAMNYYPASERQQLNDAVAHAVETGIPFDLELDFTTATGRLRRVRVMGEREESDGQVTAVVGVFQDITDRHALEMTLRRTASTDALTGICNRAAFDRALEGAIDRARQSGALMALALIDLDGFKLINDTLGHMAGDDILREVGRRLRAPWLQNCYVARLGGDEFAVIVEDAGLLARIDQFRQQLEETLSVSVTAEGLTMTCAGTVGMRLWTPETQTVRDFVHRTDAILYAAKRARVGERRKGDRRRAA